MELRDGVGVDPDSISLKLATIKHRRSVPYVTVKGEMTRVRENGATMGAGVLATYTFDSRRRRLSLTRGNGTGQTYSYDPVSRLSQLAENVGGTSEDQALGFTCNPAGQIATNTRSNHLLAARSRRHRRDAIQRTEPGDAGQ